MTTSSWIWETTDRWIRATLGGETIIDSKHAMLMIERRGEQDYYIPISDVRMDLLEVSDHVEVSDNRGIRRFWHLRVNGTTIENAAWTYEIHEQRPDFTGYLAFT